MVCTWTHEKLYYDAPHNASQSFFQRFFAAREYSLEYSSEKANRFKTAQKSTESGNRTHVQDGQT